MIRNLGELVLAIHGLGLIGGVYFIFTKDSWFSRAIGSPKVASAVAAVFWVVGGVALVSTAWAYYKNAEWQRLAALVAAIVSSVGVILWYDAVPGGAIFGQILSILIIGYLLLS